MDISSDMLLAPTYYKGKQWLSSFKFHPWPESTRLHDGREYETVVPSGLQCRRPSIGPFFTHVEVARGADGRGAPADRVAGVEHRGGRIGVELANHKVEAEISERCSGRRRTAERRVRMPGETMKLVRWAYENDLHD